MQTQFTVLLDACVFYSAPLRDLLLQLAFKGVFRGRWTDQIHDEWIRSLLKNRPDIDESALERTRAIINKSVLGGLVTDYEKLITTVSLPNPDDRHVLAAAISTQAQIIVTYNTKDFPSKILSNFGIEAQHPDSFLRYQFDLHPPVFLSCIKTIRERLKKTFAKC